MKFVVLSWKLYSITVKVPPSCKKMSQSCARANLPSVFVSGTCARELPGRLCPRVCASCVLGHPLDFLYQAPKCLRLALWFVHVFVHNIRASPGSGRVARLTSLGEELRIDEFEGLLIHQATRAFLSWQIARQIVTWHLAFRRKVKKTPAQP